MTPGAIYARKSTDMQENSIENQVELLEAYAKKNGIVIVEKYIDAGISGRSAEKRPAFMRMIEDSAGGKFSAVLIYDSSRFARNLEQSLVYKSVLKRNGVRLVSITEPTLDEDTALITDAMLGALNEMYIRKLSQSVKRGKEFAAQNGRHTANAPYGYKMIEKKLVVFEEEAQHVRMIFNMYASGESNYVIVRKLNAMGILHRKGNKWTERDIPRILGRVTYIGKILHNGQIYQGIHDPIIDMDTWNKVRDEASKKQKNERPSNEYAHWLSGILFCGNCGGRMTHTKSRTSHYYRCKGYINNTCPTHVSISTKKVEAFLKEALTGFLFDDISSGYAKAVRKIPSGNEVGLINKAIESIDKKLTRHAEAYAVGVDTLEEYSRNKKQCAKDKEDLEAKLKELSSGIETPVDRHKIKNAVSELLKLLFDDSKSIEEKNKALKKVIQKIEINKKAGEIKLFYFS